MKIGGLTQKMKELGNHKYIESPEKLLEYWEEYAAWCKSNPIRVQDFVGKDGEEVYRLKERPLTQSRFESWMYKEKKITVGQYFDNKDKAYGEFVAICSHIRNERMADQIEGGMAGIYNPSITQRLNGLVEKVQEDGNKELTIKVKYGKRDNSSRPASESGKDDAGGEAV
jgi:hypothetical protein